MPPELVTGSPPHSRGRQTVASVGTAAVGLTPAFAGKTSDAAQCNPASGAHPRIRGEDSNRCCVASTSGGSPPHSRGRRGLEAGAGVCVGLTPAFAGKTLAEAGLPEHEWAHPRIRGEDAPFACDGREKLGSPPHSRGRRPCARPPCRRRGLTPAFAGKTARKSRLACGRRAHPRIRGEDIPCRRRSPAMTGSPPHSRGRHPVSP